MGLEQIKAALVSTGANVRKTAPPPGYALPYIVYAQDGANDFKAGGRHAEKAAEGTIDLYTGDADDPLKGKIEAALDELAGTTTIDWYLNSIQYETEAGTQSSGYTGLVHFEWVFQIGG